MSLAGRSGSSVHLYPAYHLYTDLYPLVTQLLVPPRCYPQTFRCPKSHLVSGFQWPCEQLFCLHTNPFPLGPSVPHTRNEDCGMVPKRWSRSTRVPAAVWQSKSPRRTIRIDTSVFCMVGKSIPSTTTYKIVQPIGQVLCHSSTVDRLGPCRGTYCAVQPVLEQSSE